MDAAQQHLLCGRVAMYPVPLKGPDGVIWTHACGVCKAQATHNEEAPKLGPGYRQAERCCKCHVPGCNEQVAKHRYGMCREHGLWPTFIDVWERIGNEVFLSRLRSADVEGRVRGLLQDSE